jgi:hypothetical protein
MNPTLSDLIGGIHAVTLSDEEAKRRGTQKTVLERKAPPTFDIVVEIMEINKLAIHHDVSEVVDRMLRGMISSPEIRFRKPDGEVEAIAAQQPEYGFEEMPSRFEVAEMGRPRYSSRTLRIFPYGVSRNKLERALTDLQVRAEIVKHPEQADAILTLKSSYRRGPDKFHAAVAANVAVHVLRSNTYQQILGAVREMFHLTSLGAEERAMREAQEAIQHVLETSEPAELSPQPSYLRRLQHQLANQYEVHSESVGVEPNRRIRVSK